MVIITPIKLFLCSTMIILNRFHASADMVCTESHNKSKYAAPRRMDCLLSGTGDNKFQPEILSNSRKNGYNLLTITTDGHLIMPSMAINETTVAEVSIKAKQGVTLADSVFAGTDIQLLSINYNREVQFTSNYSSETILKFDGLNVETLKISGFMGFDFSKIERLERLHYVGSSEGQTIEWPSPSILENLIELKMTTDKFLPHFTQLKNLVKLEIHSLSSPSEAKPVANLMDTLMQMDLAYMRILLLGKCYTPEVINLPFSQFSNLEVLTLDDNNLASLPADPEKGLGKNVNLTYALFRNNNISEIPPNFFRLHTDRNYVSLIRNSVRKIELNAFTGVSTLDIWLADDAVISLQSLQGVSSMELYVKGNSTISGFPSEPAERIFEEIDIRCNRDVRSCANVCPIITSQVCDTVQFNKDVKIESQLCRGKYDGFCG